MVGAIDGMDVMGKDEGANEGSAGAIPSATTARQVQLQSESQGERGIRIRKVRY